MDSYSLFITYSLFLISFDGFQLNLENTSATENASSLLIFKFRGQGHVDILSFQPLAYDIETRIGFVVSILNMFTKFD
jgi:hypothetical protein